MENLSHDKPGRCTSYAPWGSGLPYQRCMYGTGHEVRHRDRYGNEWGEAAPGPVTAPAEDSRRLAEIRALLAAFDWEHHDRQLALEAIERIVEGGQA